MFGRATITFGIGPHSSSAQNVFVNTNLLLTVIMIFLKIGLHLANLRERL